jgi:pimeloyl-ACP methyl ester carboxylesterase
MSSPAAHAPTYAPLFPARSEFRSVRGLRYHFLVWGDLERATDAQPLLVMVHGWMDTAASFQFMVDALRAQPGWAERPIVALDWRGFGQTETPPATDSYFFADYLGDLDVILHQLSPDRAVDLLGHSMGGNVVMLYAGVRSERIRKLVNLEGFGMPTTQPGDAPQRYVKWLDGIQQPVRLKDYDSRDAVAKRLQATNPLLRAEFAHWLAQHWAREENGRWVINADPVHKRPQPFLYRVEEVNAFLSSIACPVLFVEGAQTLYFMFFNGKFTREEFLQRVALVSDFRLETIDQAAHMLHHDQPEALAAHLAGFLSPGNHDSLMAAGHAKPPSA